MATSKMVTSSTPDSSRPPNDFGRYAALGMQYALTMALLGALGWWLDTRLSTTPWLLVLGFMLGAVGGFVMVVRAVPAARRRPPGRSE